MIWVRYVENKNTTYNFKLGITREGDDIKMSPEKYNPSLYYNQKVVQSACGVYHTLLLTSSFID